MEKRDIYQIGDKVQAHDGRIGIVIDTEKSADTAEPSNVQHIVVKFPDGSTVDGLSDKFRAVSDRPFGRVNQR